MSFESRDKVDLAVIMIDHDSSAIQSRLQSFFTDDYKGEKRSLREESSVSTGVANGVP